MSNQLTLAQILKIKNFDEKIAKLTELRNVIHSQLVVNVNEITECKTLEDMTKNSEDYRKLKDEYDLLQSELISSYLNEIKTSLTK